MSLPIVLSLQLFLHAHSLDCERLVRELGAREFAVREAATKRLSTLPLALPHVRRAMWAGTLEQRGRARKVETAILTETLLKREAELLRKARAWGEAGRLDLVAEVCSRPEFRTVERCETLFAVGNGVYATVGKREERIALNRERLKPLELGTRKRRLLDFDRVPEVLPQPFPPLFARFGRSVSASDPLFLGGSREQLDTVLGGSQVTLVSGGPLVARLYRSSGAVVIADGDLTLTEHHPDANDLGGWMSASVFIASGNIRITQDTRFTNSAPSISDCVFLAGGNVTTDTIFMSLSNCRVIAGGKAQHAGGGRKFRNTLPPTENATEPLAPFRFFALAEVGLHAADAKGAVTVTKVDAKSPMGRSGVKAGDVVVAVDGRPAKDVTELRRLVRTGYVMGDCALVVRRGEETTELVVRFPD